MKTTALLISICFIACNAIAQTTDSFVVPDATYENAGYYPVMEEVYDEESGGTITVTKTYNTDDIIHNASSHEDSETCLFSLTANAQLIYSYGGQYGYIQNLDADKNPGKNAVTYYNLNGVATSPDQGLKLYDYILPYNSEEGSDEVPAVYTIINITQSPIVVYPHIFLANNSYNSNKQGIVYCTYTDKDNNTDGKLYGAEEITERTTEWFYGQQGVALTAGSSITIGVKNTHLEDVINLWLFALEATTSTSTEANDPTSADAETILPMVNEIEETITLTTGSLSQTFDPASKILETIDENGTPVAVPEMKFTYIEFTSTTELTVTYNDNNSKTSTSIIIEATDIDLSKSLIISASTDATVTYTVHTDEYVAPEPDRDFTITLTGTPAETVTQTISQAELIAQIEDPTYIVFNSTSPFAIDNNDATLDNGTYTYTLILTDSTNGATLSATIPDTGTATITYYIHSDSYIPTVGEQDIIYEFSYDELCTVRECLGEEIATDSQKLSTEDFQGLNSFLTLLSDTELSEYGIDAGQNQLRYSESTNSVNYHAIQIKGPALKFTVQGESLITVAFASTGSTNTSTYGLYDGQNFIVALNDKELTANTNTANTYQVYGKTYVTSYWQVTTGTYYIYTKVDGTQNRGAKTNHISITDSKGTSLTSYVCGGDGNNGTASQSENAIDNVQVDRVEVDRYNLAGQKLTTKRRGLNIIRYSDGSTEKVLVK